METTSRPRSSKRDRTRQRILEAAATAFRKHGIDGIGVRDIMRQSGLTPGGFYFHFRDKETLFAEVTRDTMGDAWLYESLQEAPAGRELEYFIGRYLSSDHRDHLESGCLISALGSDVARGSGRRRREFSRRAAAMVERISRYMPGADVPTRMRRAGVLMASMAGVLMVSRLLVEKDRSDSLLAEARRFFGASFASAA